MSEIFDSLTTLKQEKDQRDDAIKVKVALQRVYDVIVEANAEIQNIVDGGSFNTIPTNVKTVMNSAWTTLKASQAAFEDSEIQEVIQWPKVVAASTEE